ncbi:MAG: energy transducer TonB [Sphingobium sp.]
MTITMHSFKEPARCLAAGILALSLGSGLAGAAQAQENPTGFRSAVEQDIDQTLRLPRTADDVLHNRTGRSAVATVAVMIDAQGRISAADIVESTGWRDFDAEALRTARAVSYPATGKPRSIAMVLGFNKTVTADMRQAAQRQVLAWREDRRVRLANRIDAQQPDS